tara:strand:- start:730 stop:921 length:192 start_codon:yes stop_codon:yes gene_type:complete
MKILKADSQEDLTSPELLAFAYQYQLMWESLYGSAPRGMHLIPEDQGEDGAVLIIDFQTSQSS